MAVDAGRNDRFAAHANALAQAHRRQLDRSLRCALALEEHLVPVAEGRLAMIDDACQRMATQWQVLPAPASPSLQSGCPLALARAPGDMTKPEQQQSQNQQCRHEEHAGLLYRFRKDLLLTQEE